MAIRGLRTCVGEGCNGEEGVVLSSCLEWEGWGTFSSVTGTVLGCIGISECSKTPGSFGCVGGDRLLLGGLERVADDIEGGFLAVFALAGWVFEILGAGMVVCFSVTIFTKVSKI